MASLQEEIATGAASIKEGRAALRAEVKELRAQLGFEQKREKSAKICAELLARIDQALAEEPSAAVSAGVAPAISAAAPATPVEPAATPAAPATVSSATPSRSFKLGVYSAFSDEVDLDLLIQGAYERGVEVSFPCMMHDAHGIAGACEQTMEFRRISKGDYLASEEALGTGGSTRKTALAEGESGVPFLLHPLRRYHHDSPELASMPYVAADELDMLVCPCVAFDTQGNRLGYGAGNYDRYLSQLLEPGTLNFVAGVQIVGVAFAEQQVPSIPVEEHDIPLPFVWA
ncbi:MAG: 5-formyltetrahydrofolate cyclo-ligase [Coriobacteriia bacterium]|nr:5-formyltetrahydrofolate cyclo-ligase [Coriobacteriia bacterium]